MTLVVIWISLRKCMSPSVSSSSPLDFSLSVYEVCKKQKQKHKTSTCNRETKNETNLQIFSATTTKYYLLQGVVSYFYALAYYLVTNVFAV